jgi:hypothetical protein
MKKFLSWTTNYDYVDNRRKIFAVVISFVWRARFFLETTFGQEFSNGSSFAKKLKQTLFGSKMRANNNKKKTHPNAHYLVKVLLL